MTMLTLSHPAATLLTDARSQQGIPDDALLRVAGATDGREGISLGFVDAPMEGDHTAEVHGLGVCVAPDVAEALSGAKIDVQESAPDSTEPVSLVIVPAD
jgi:Fe-S cluster assembly iron-binding protein IscA